METTKQPDAIVNLAANVRRILAQRGWTQADLARASGQTNNTISRIVHAVNGANIGVLASISEALNVSPNRLLAPPKQKKIAKSRKRG